MSRTIDERVVEMRFDNRQFESGVRQSLSTLDRLKAALKLDDSAKSFAKLDKAANSVSLAGISAGVEELQKRFSTMGIVGMRVIENITDSLMRMGTKAFGYVNNAIISGGMRRAQNIENAHFQLQALLKDEEKVQAIMDDAMQSVDGTAYAYDEAAKAASQFAASGLQAGKEMQNALKAVTGVAAMTNSDYESISRIFTTVAGNGRLMGDQLLQLGARGMNAAATLADFFKEVRGQSNMTEAAIREMTTKGEISFKTFAEAMEWAFGESAFRANETFTGALANMKSALSRIGAGFFSPLIEQNSDLILLINTVRERINDIKKALVFDEQASAISGLAKATNVETEALNTFFNEIDENGSMTTHHLNELSSVGVDAADSLTKYINGVTDGSIRASYATKTALSELTEDMEVNKEQVEKFVEDGKISMAMFTSAMETAYGDEKKLSKQFTDFFLDSARSISEYLKTLDLTKPMKIFNNVIGAAKNLLKGLYSVIKPIGTAFANVFLSSKVADGLVDLTSKIEKFTSKMKLSEKGSENLQAVFNGLFNVVKLVIDGFVGLFRAVVPVAEPVGSLTDIILSLFGAMGRGLTSITDFIRESTLLNSLFGLLVKGFKIIGKVIDDFLWEFDNFFDYISNLPIVKTSIDAIIGAFYLLYTTGGKFLINFTNMIKDFGIALTNLFPKKTEKQVEGARESVDNLSSSFEKLTNTLSGNNGLMEFVRNLKLYFEELIEHINFDKIVNIVQTIKNVITDLVSLMGKTIPQIFDDFSFGGVASTAGGLGIIYVMIKLAETFSNFGKTIDNLTGSIPKTLKSIQKALTEYQNNLKADTLLKIAKAIGILAVALTVLSFADTERVYYAAIALGAIGAALIAATAYFVDVSKKTPKIETILNNLTTGLTKSLNKLATGVKWKLIGSAVKDMGITLGIIAASIAGMVYLYSKDPENTEKAVKLIEIIGGVMLGVVSLMAIFGSGLNSKMTSFLKMGGTLLAISLSMALIVGSLNKLFAMEIPEDWLARLGIIGGILAGLSVLVMVIAIASNLAGEGNSIKAGPILAFAAFIYVTVSSLKKLFEMDLPSDYKEKFNLLKGIFEAFGLVILAIGVASHLSKDGLKATGTILAMCAFVAVATGSLMVLSIFPAEKMIFGAISLGIVLIALGLSLVGAGKVADKDTYRTVLAMAAMVGAITVALGVLSLISWKNLLKGAIALGSVLLVLAADFYASSKITDKMSFASIVAMALNVAVIAIALTALSAYNWESLLSAAGSLSGVLLAVAGAFKIISGTKPDFGSIVSFLSATFGVIVIAFALSMLAEHPWQNMVGVATAISEVLLAMGISFVIMGRARLNITSLLSFVAGIIGIYAIGHILKELASNTSWKEMLGIATAISEVLLAMSAAMVICAVAGSAAQAALVGIVLLDAFIADVGLVLWALEELAGDSENFLAKGGEILVRLGEYLGDFIGNIIGGAISGISDSFPKIGENLSSFADNAQRFFDLISNLNQNTLNGAKMLAQTIILLTASEFVDAIASFFGGGETRFDEFGDSLEGLGEAISGFAAQIEGISGTDVEAAANAALALAQLYEVLPKEDGWIQKIFGNQTDLSDFATQLRSFGTALVAYCKIVDGNINQEAVEASKSAAEVLIGLQDMLPKEDGWMQKIFGEQTNLQEFGLQLKDFATGMVDYSKTIADLDTGAVEASKSAAEILIGLEGALSRNGGFAQFMLGKKSLKSFGEELVPFGESLYAYYISVSEIDTAKLSLVILQLQKLVQLNSDMESVNPSTLSYFGTALAEMGNQGIKAFTDTFEDGYSTAKSAIDKFVKKITNSLDTSFKKLTSSMEKHGKNIVDGLDKGIKKQQNVVIKTITKLAKDIDTAFTDIMKIQSPSKLMEERGEQVDQGLEKGIKKETPSILKSVKKIGTSIADTLSKSIGNIEDIGVGIGTAISETVEEIDKERITTSLDKMLDGIENAQKRYEILSDEASKVKEGKLKIEEVLNADSLTSESEYWEKLYILKKEGVEKSKYEDSTFLDFEKDILEETTALMSNYADKLESTRDSMMGSDLFSEVSEKTAKSKEEIKKNLQDQIKQIDSYASVMNSLNEKLEGTNLLDYIQTLGVDSVEQLKVINNMTEEELTEYANLYDSKLQSATQAASIQLQDLQLETEQKLADIFGVMGNAVNLYDFSSIFDGSLASIKAYVASIPAEFQQYELELVDVSGALAVAISEGVTKGVKSKGTGKEVVSTIKEEAEEETKKSIDDWIKLGEHMTSGTAEGITDSESEGVAKNAAQKATSNIMEAFKKAAEIASPSQLMKREVGVYLADGIAEGITEGSESISDSVTEVMNIILEGFENADLGDFSTKIGQVLVDGMVQGIEIQKPILITNSTMLCNELVVLYEESLSSIVFDPIGQNIIIYLTDGILSKKPFIIAVSKTLCYDVIQAFRETFTREALFEIGAYAAQGLADGIESKIKKIADAAIKAAKKAIQSAKDALGEASPSKVFFEIGEYASIGLANGIIAKTSRVGDATEAVAESSIDTMNNVIRRLSATLEDNDDFQPTIRPVMDLSNVEEGIESITDMFNRRLNLSTYENLLSASQSFARNSKSKQVSNEVNGSDKQKGNNYYFEQNNYSPTTLSRVEIYRQTKNLFSTWKGAVESS